MLELTCGVSLGFKLPGELVEEHLQSGSWHADSIHGSADGSCARTLTKANITNHKTHFILSEYS